MSEYSLTLYGWHPMTMNQRERTHWAIRKRELDSLAHEIHLLSTALRIPLADGPREVTITLIKTSRGKRDDPGNLYARSKSVLDALVRNRLLLDDDPHSLTNLRVLEERAEKKATRITIKEAA